MKFKIKLSESFRSRIKDKKFPLLIELIKWKLIDFKRFVFDKNRKIHIYGIYGFLGLPGTGKTMAMSFTLEELRHKYDDDIYIFTNYNFIGQDAPFTTWKMLLKNYDKPSVFAWDEVQNEFNSRDFSKFPVELLTLLTQNRKGHGKRIYWTAQRWNRVDKVFRELTHRVTECKTRFGRLTSIKQFDWEDYEQLHSSTQVEQKMRIKPIRWRMFIQTDKLRDCYDSFKMLDTAKSKDYIDYQDVSFKNLRNA